jgi:broad-specificity NMP kinase
MTIVVNLVGGPCCGKSTTASGLFHAMKLKTKQKVEVVNEVVKGYVYSENKEALADQVLITAEQNHLIRRLQGKVDFVISDASLLNGIVYNEFYDDVDNLSTSLSRKLYDKYDNMVFLLPRKPEYDQYGRTQTLEEAQFIDELFVKNLDELDIQYYDMREYTHEEMPERILEVLAKRCIFEVK